MNSRTVLPVLAFAGAAILLAGCTQAAGAGTAASPSPSASAVSAEDFDLDALVAAAQAEGELVVWDSSSSVEDIAAAFEAEYGIVTTGLKVDKEEQVEKLTKEAAGGAPSVDVINFADTGSLGGQLLPAGLVSSWLPPDLAADIDPGSQDPLVAVWNGNLFFYSPDNYPQGCPVDNIWALTDPAFAQRLTLEDPLQAPQLADFFTELGLHAEEDLAEAYESYFGEPFAAGEFDTAAQALIAGLAANSPLVVADDDDALASAIAENPESPLFFSSQDAWKDAEEEGGSLAACEGMEPFLGYASPKFVVQVTDNAHPNAAKLWAHFMLTAEGVEPVLEKGGWSANTTVPDTAELAPGAAADRSDLFLFDVTTIADDWANRQATLDLWAEHLS